MEDNILKLPKSLTKDENITLFKKMLNSSKEEAKEIRKNIITGNLKLVVETIKKYNVSISGSLDLPFSLHDKFRVTKTGKSTLQ